MNLKRLLPVLALNALGLLLFFSWYLPRGHGFWQPLDAGVFFCFQNKIAASEAFATLVAVTNLRPFDCVAFLAMLLVFAYHYRKKNRAGRRWMLAMGLSMFVAVFFAKQFDLWMDIERDSPTLYYAAQGVDVLRVHLLTGIPAKDGSDLSFPGDHTMMLMIFAFFMVRYFGKETRLVSLAILVLFSLPRLMGGAHWLTDDVCGAGAICLVVLPWLLLTPASDKIIAWIEKKLPARLGGK